MSPRVLLSSEQRTRLFAPLVDPAEMVRHYTLGADDLALIRTKRRSINRLGFAVQLCLLRYPGLGMGPAEQPPAAMIGFVAHQLSLSPAIFADYAFRDQTRREHAVELQRHLGLRSFGLADWRACLRIGAGAAWATDRGEPIVQAMLAHLRANGIVLPSAAVLERIGLAARARARNTTFETLAAGMTDAELDKLGRLLTVDPELRRSRFAWLRDYSESPAPSNIVALLDRLEYARELGIDSARTRSIHAARLTRLIDEGAIMTVQHIADLEPARRTAILIVQAASLGTRLTDATLAMFEKYMGTLFSRAQNRDERRFQATRRDVARALALFRRTITALRHAKEAGEDGVAVVEREIGMEQLDNVLPVIGAVADVAGQDILVTAAERYSVLRRFSPRFLAAFDFRSNTPSDPVLAAIELLRAMDRDGTRVLPRRPPASFLPPQWRRLIRRTQVIVATPEGEVAMTKRMRRSDGSGRVPLFSPGRPVVAGRDEQRRFWAAITAGMASEDAAAGAGISQAVGIRLFRKAGGMPPAIFRPSAKPLSGRYLSFAEREEIALLRVQGCSVREVARRLGRTASTISRELRRNAATRSGGLEYRATTAQWHAERSARRPKQAKLALNAALRTYVEERLGGVVVAPSGAPVSGPAVPWKGRRHGPRQHRRWASAWSPEQIARRLPVDFPDDETMRISHEAIYQALFVQSRGALRRELAACLRTGRVLRIPRARTRGRGKTFISPEIMISQRPAEVVDRAVPGHWEGDLILGRGSSAIGTLVERMTRFTLLLHLPRMMGHGHEARVKNGPALAGHGADAVCDAITQTIITLPEQLRRSLTWDQGAEMAQHARLQIDAGIQVYFCDPHSPWQRGTNENTNGLLRQYFPKGTDLSTHGIDEIAAVAAALNSRPRKTLAWKTPAEALDQLLISAMSSDARN